MENYFAQGQEAFQNALDQGVPPGDAAQQAGDIMSQGLMDAGFPPEMIQAGMEAGMQSFQQGIDGNMPPMDAFSQAANMGMDAGSNMFDDQMPDMDEIGMTAFQDAMANGASPAEAADTAVNAITQAGEEFGIPPEMMEAGINAGMAAFNDAMANGDSPEGAFGTALDAGGDAADAFMDQSGFNMDFVDMQAGMEAIEGGPGEMGGMTADMMDAIPPGAMGGMGPDHMANIPP